MPEYLQLFILIPLLGFLVSLLLPRNKERIISWVVVSTTTIQFAGIVVFIILWLINGANILDIKHAVLYQGDSFEFFIDFYFDKTTAVFAFTGSLIILLVSIFSKYYLHRDEGFKRFFNTLLLFFLGYNLVIFSGNFETLFIGWEILGFCSFLLIAFYRDRYLPVKNGLKVISVYRLGDVCLMLAMWMCHHIFHENITFLQLADGELIAAYLNNHSAPIIFTSIMIVTAAAAKSGMLPFSSWVPRAMEGPTTSSAVFYGSLSIHLGAFLLIRTYPFWESLIEIKILIIALGLATSLVAASIARVQSTVKTQIAYSSITQIGFIFIEVALGFHTLALIHFAGNAFLRTYQLLVSPSVLSYEIHDMIFNYKKHAHKPLSPFLQKMKNGIYMLSIKEWNLDWFLYHFLWSPFKWIGRKMNLAGKGAAIIMLSVLLIGGLLSVQYSDKLPESISPILPYVFSLAALLFILASFGTRGNSKNAWLLIIAGQCLVTLSIVLNSAVPFHQVLIYFSGVIIPGIVGYLCLNSIHAIDDDINLNQFHGYTYETPKAGFIFLVCALALIGFPITPTFLGIDLLFTHIKSYQVILIITTTLSFIFIELAVLRIYARIFLGQHKKNYHPIAYRSS